MNRKDLLQLIAKELRQPDLTEADLISDFFLEEFTVVKAIEKEFKIIITDDNLFLKHQLVGDFIDYVMYYR